MPPAARPRSCCATTRSTGTTWTSRHEAWIAARHFEDPAVKTAFSFYRSSVTTERTTRDAITSELTPYFDHPLFAGPVHRLCAYRGIDYLGALTIVCEVCDFRRFAHSGAFMGFCGLVPSEYSSGASVPRGHITHAGNVHVRTASSSLPGPTSTARAQGSR
ncbi:MAG: transposase [Acidimicrobiales bacterium]